MAVLWVLLVSLIIATPATADIAGKPGTVHAITGARIVAAPGVEPIEGVILIRDGVIEAVGADVTVPPDARIHDRTGRTIYSGLIEAYLRLDSTIDPAEKVRTGAVHENPAVRSEARALDRLPLPGKLLEKMRESGFTIAFIAPADGVFRGSGAVIGLVDDEPRSHVLRSEAAQVVAFEHGLREDVYPGSLMGAIALMRQTCLDAGWLHRMREAWESHPTEVERPDANRSLEALLPAIDGQQPMMIECEDLPMIERAARVVRELGVAPIIISGGSDEYRDIEWFERTLRSIDAGLVLTVNFPPVPCWELEDQKTDIELDALIRWERAPTSPGLIAATSIPFAISTQGLSESDSVFTRLARAIELGLPAATALASLTTEPARILGIADRTGTIEPGKNANLTVTSGEIFADGTRVVEVWIDGLRHGDEPKQARITDAAKRWHLEIGRPPERVELDVKLSIDAGELTGEVVPPEAEEPDTTGTEDDGGDDAERIALGDVRFLRGHLSFTIPADATALGREIRFGGRIADDLMPGIAVVNGDSTTALARRAQKPRKSRDDVDTPVSADAPLWPPLPDPSQPTTVHVTNATIWTSGPRGVLENADLIVSDGVVTAVGIDLETPSGAAVVDATGRHVTPGIIDAHSHSLVTADTNEATESSTAEVRILDTLDPWAPAIYRELAGGVTASHQLHGSANVIGGQDAVVKYRWGGMIDDLAFAEAPPGLKLALGENVKQSNWGDRYRTRYPQSRMGVEQFARDRFLAAIDYREKQKAFDDGREPAPPRRDLELDALSEVLEGSRTIHCHAYRQDEMLMLMRVMEELDVRIGTFDHALEGYKIADEMAAHGVGATIFSDWWAYKFEVYDAIPYAGHVMWERGVVVSLKSDSQELARRLNLEAAKAVKYGRMPEEDALRCITLNAATQLGVDRWVGSLEPGKQADFVIWSDHPLSDRAVCLETWVDGRRCFSRETDLDARVAAEALRTKLLLRAERAGGGGGCSKAFTPTFGRTFGGSAADQERGWVEDDMGADAFPRRREGR